MSPPRSTWVRPVDSPGPNSPNESKSSTGFVDLNWAFIPGDRFGRATPRVIDRHGTPVASIEDQTLGVILDGLGPAVITPHGAFGRKRLHEGTRALLAVVATDTEPLFIPTPDAIQSRLDRTIGSWRRWAELLDCDGPWKLAVRRSALALKTLLAEQSGAIAAAATTSLPERIGGPKNWDYRYAWVRDSSFTLDALINLGLHEEVHGAVSWLLSAIRDNGGDLHVFYSLDGTIADRAGDTRHPRLAATADPSVPGTPPQIRPNSAPTATCSTPSAATAPKDTSSTRPRAACSPISPIAAATGGDTATRASGSSRPAGTTPSRRSAAGSRSTGPSPRRDGADPGPAHRTLAFGRRRDPRLGQ